LLFAAKKHGDLKPRPKLLYGARGISDVVLLDEAQKLTRLEISTDDGSRGHHGLVVDLLDGAIEGSSRAVEIWTCGPEPMMEAVATRAETLGVKCKVSVEARMACGRGLCLGCAREDSEGVPKYVCSDGPVFGAREIYSFLGSQDAAAQPGAVRDG
jgi:dihydroorotate dehydrogenase electron transfer subunit